MRYIIRLNYNGAAFCGWQSQPHDPSVQQTVEEAAARILGEPVSITGAGRTDTGVNAIGYTAHFEYPSEASSVHAGEALDCSQLRYKLNAILPESIVVESIEKAADDFHARFNASRREYTYFLHTVKDPFVSSFSFQCTFPLDFEAMNRAAAFLAGKHDFSCFEKSGADNKTSVCTVEEAFWKEYTPSIQGIAGVRSEGRYWYFRISADRFLRNMVRAIVGTLIDVGRGKRSVEDFAALVLPPDISPEKVRRRSLAGESVPGKALFLSKIEY